MFNPIHQHMLIRAHLTDAPTLSEDDAKDMLVHLVNAIGMTPVTPPQSVYVTEEGNKGLTGSINLSSSHIAYHCWDERLLLMFDVYSCCKFDEQVVGEIIATYFPLKDMSFITIDRLTF